MAIDEGHQNMDPKDRCVRLEATELTIGMGLTADEYAELLLNYLIQLHPTKAKFCYMRAIEKFERNQLLKDIWTFGEHVCKQNYSKALRICNEITLGQPLQQFIDELKRRLTASQLFAIAKSYSSISLTKLANLLGVVDPSNILHELKQKCFWSVNDDGFIIPVMSDEFKQFVTSLSDPKFGLVTIDVKSPSKMTTQSVEMTMKSLVDTAIFFDGMAAPTTIEGTGTATNSNNPNN